jgi:hypothetical protein
MKISIKKTLSFVAIFSLIFVSISNLVISRVFAGFASSASVQMSDSRPTEPEVTYTALFTPSDTTLIRCVKIAFNTQADMAGSSPSGMLTDTAVKGSFSNLTAGSWTLNTATDGEIRYTNAAGENTAASPTSIATTTIHNTSLSTFYAQISTYTNTNCSTGPVDQSNVIALVTVGGITATVVVAPTVTFDVANYGSAVNTSGDTAPTNVSTSNSAISFGTVAAGATKWGSQTLTVSTNGVHGYTLYTRYSGAMTDANGDTIRNQSGTPSSGNAFDASASQSSFAYTTDADSPYNFGGTVNRWAGLTTTNTAINANSGAIDSDVTLIEYKIGISNVQPPGTYSTVIAYTATPSY